MLNCLDYQSIVQICRIIPERIWVLGLDLPVARLNLHPHGAKPLNLQ